MKPISESTSRIAGKTFSRKYIALGRIVNQWNEIMGSEFADKAQPVKLSYRKNGRGAKPVATLEIATSAAYATLLPYQKDVILERIRTLFGHASITDVKFVASKLPEEPVQRKKPPTPLTAQEKRGLSNVLNIVEDDAMKEKLESLGKAILMERKHEG